MDEKGGVGAASAFLRERLARNDLVDIREGGAETVNGSYVVSRDCTQKPPSLSPIRAQGGTTDQIEDDIAAQLLADEFSVERPRLSVWVTDFASVTVSVSGAVFHPFTVEIGGIQGDRIDTLRQGALGASTQVRDLSAALRAAGGLRADADLPVGEVRREGSVHCVGMRAVFDSQNALDVMLLTGDEVSVPNRECFQEHLIRSGPINPSGISLFLSNLTQPAISKASSPVA